MTPIFYKLPLWLRFNMIDRHLSRLSITKRCDVFLYIDETHALHPLHMPEVEEEEQQDKELPETFPTGL